MIYLVSGQQQLFESNNYKTISLEEYTDINRKLNKINRDLTNVTENIRKENKENNNG